jgi:hypothetical protein
MASYTVRGHPLNPATLAATPGAAVDAGLASALDTKGVGQTVTLTLSGPDDTKAKAHGCVT